MLTHFPTPYPGEWWYSVLCRYFVRTGYRNFATASRELYGARKAIHGRLFPGSSCYQVVSKLPEGILDIKRILLEHTLMPYYLRFYPAMKKERVLQSLLQGKPGGLTSIDLLGVEGVEGLKYCPLCYQEDIKRYGEPYWHREHQIPLMPCCIKHKCPLIKHNVKYSSLSEAYLPLCTIQPNDRPGGMEEHWQEPLTLILDAFLNMPFDYEPTREDSNLRIKLLEMGLGISKTQKKESLDSSKVYQAARDFYGEAVAVRYFSKVSAPILYRLCNWTLTSPERYALLAVMAGLTAEELFGALMEYQDPCLLRLLQFREQGVVYRKEELARKMKLRPAQVDTLARKYGIQPFWKQNGRSHMKRSESLRLNLTREEKKQIELAAKKNGGGQTAVYARTVLLQAAKECLQSSGNS